MKEEELFSIKLNCCQFIFINFIFIYQTNEIILKKKTYHLCNNKFIFDEIYLNNKKNNSKINTNNNNIYN